MTRVIVFPVNRSSGKVNASVPSSTIMSWIERDDIMTRTLAIYMNKGTDSPDTSSVDQDAFEILCAYDETGTLTESIISNDNSMYIVCELDLCNATDDLVSMATMVSGAHDQVVNMVKGPELSWVFIQRDPETTVDTSADSAYLNLLKDLVDMSAVHGTQRNNRTDIDTVSAFAKQIRIDISQGKFPLLTTKRVPFRLAAEELLWFARGETDSKTLENNGVNIWKANSSRQFLDKHGLFSLEEGDIGPGYGWQWRRFGAPYKGSLPKNRALYGADAGVGFDQLAYVENLLKRDPMSRRILMCAWAPHQLQDMALPPCHVMAQWYVTRVNGTNELSCMLTMRSCDTFLGLPWNIASYALLTYILAKKCEMVPSELVVNMGDCHLYANCVEQAKLQLTREPGISPHITIDDSVRDKSWEQICTSDFAIHGYYPQPVIKADMAV